MKILLDTHMLLWAADGTLGGKAADLVGDPGNTLFFSPASIWEISIKKGLGRSDFAVDPEALCRGLLDNQYIEIPITGAHALVVGGLPMLHKDPFDRILLAQAETEGMSLLTSDGLLPQYGDSVIFLSRS